MIISMTSGVDMQVETRGYALIAEAAIREAFVQCERAMKFKLRKTKNSVATQKDICASMQKIVEFSERSTNPLLSGYCDNFEIDETRVRQALKSKALDAYQFVHAQ